MTRATGGKLRLQGLEESEKKTLWVFGGVRPLIGAVFGSLVFLVIEGGIVDLIVPTDADSALFLFSIFGFVAGFSERFAKDVLSRVEGTLPPSGTPSGQGGSTLP
jgi:hypothetical protein